MTWRTNVLVLANVTASSDELLGALVRLSEREPTHFELIVPAGPFGGSRDSATANLNAALARLRDAGLDADGSVGDDDPCVAVSEVYDPKQHDRIVVSTLPLGSSKWLHAGLPERIAKLTAADVTHVVASAPPKPHPAVPAPPNPAQTEHLGPLLAPYASLGHSAETRRQHRL